MTKKRRISNKGNYEMLNKEMLDKKTFKTKDDITSTYEDGDFRGKAKRKTGKETSEIHKKEEDTTKGKLCFRFRKK